MSAQESYGPYVRLWGISHHQLPPPDASVEQLTSFAEPILREAASFLSSVRANEDGNDGDGDGNGSWRFTGRKTFTQSAAPVNLYQRVVSRSDLAAVAGRHQRCMDGVQAETWTLRRSRHRDAAEAGTAAWEEWVRAFKEEHAEAEKGFTPTVVSTSLARTWECGGITISSPAGLDPASAIGWHAVTLKLEESVHKMPWPLRARVFPVLQLTASARHRREFIVVQIAVTPDEGDSEEKRADGALRGAYTSVERFVADGEGSVEWVMAAVSDARGVLPGWVQRLAVPSRIAADVGLFLGWIGGRRSESRLPE